MKNFSTVLFYFIFLCVSSICTEKSTEEKLNETFKFYADKTFSPVQCNKTHCFCVGKDGKKIGNYHGLISSAKDMDCFCAREKKEFEEQKNIGKMFRCAPNGSFESIQCKGSICFCVNWKGTIDIRKFVPIDEIDTLPCSKKAKQS